VSGTLKYRIGIWLFVLVVIAGLYVWRKGLGRPSLDDQAVAAPAFTPKPLALDRFTLTDREGKPFRFESLQGKVWVASFFFTSCRTLCLRLNSQVAEITTKVADLPVEFVSISVDPENDTPARLAEYARQMGADPDQWKFVVAQQADVEPLANEFVVSAGAAIDDAGHASLTHSDRLILVDADGRAIAAISATDEAAVTTLVRRIRKLVESR
jgi:protein SCO1/2